MTSFDARERSVESSRPVELYEFVLGGQAFRFTSAEDDITIIATGDVFQEAGVSRTKILQGADQGRKNLVVNMPSSLAFPRLYIKTTPGERATFSLFRLQRDEVPAQDTIVPLFIGKVQSVEFPNDGNSAKITIKSREAALARNMPRVSYMAQCNNFLYDRFCGADPSSFNHIGVVSLVSGNSITVIGLGASGFDFVSGFCRPTTENDFRMVIAQSGDVITVNMPFAEDPTGGNMQSFAGCDHNIEGDCALTFDRVKFFMGFAFVPNKEIFSTGLN